MRRFPVVIILSLVLVGCAATPGRTPDAAARLQIARQAWLADNYERALPLLGRLARGGNARAQYALGYMYYMGQGVEQNTRTALIWIQRAADNGSELAIEALGRIASGSLVRGVAPTEQTGKTKQK